MPRASNGDDDGKDGPIADAESFAAAFHVKPESIQKLRTYANLLAQWQKAVNLVAPGTLAEVWHRHFADSAQVAPLIPEDAATVVDIGSGGGFPGLVLAVMLAERPGGGPKITLVESDQRKAAFLREVARTLGLAVEILVARIEKPETQLKVGTAEVVTARAFAPLERLFALALPILGPGSLLVLPKGRAAEAEIADARRAFAFDAELVPSRTEPDARIVLVRHLASRTEVS